MKTLMRLESKYAAFDTLKGEFMFSSGPIKGVGLVPISFEEMKRQEASDALKERTEAATAKDTDRAEDLAEAVEWLRSLASMRDACHTKGLAAAILGELGLPKASA